MADIQRRLTAILNKPSNKVCADCDAKNPRWVSLSLGVLVCIRCCGHHRNLGVHISKMKSVTLDKWLPEWFLIFETLNNEEVNKYWEDRKPGHIRKPMEGTSNPDVERYIRDKYQFRQWVTAGKDAPVQAVLKGTYNVKPEAKVSVVETFTPSFPAPTQKVVDLLVMDEPVMVKAKEEEVTWFSAPEPQETYKPAVVNWEVPAFPAPPTTQAVPVQSSTPTHRDAHIQAILSMYQQVPSVPPPSQTSTFRPLGAIAAEQMLRSSNYSPQLPIWPSY